MPMNYADFNPIKWIFFFNVILIGLSISACGNDDDLIELCPPISACSNSPVDAEDFSGEIYKIVETRPSFPGCELLERDLQWPCTQEEIGEFVAQNLVYPEEARSQGLERDVIVSFIVDKVSGCAANISILRGEGDGFGKEAQRVIAIMPNLNPGKQRGTPVYVQINHEIKFRL